MPGRRTASAGPLGPVLRGSVQLVVAYSANGLNLHHNEPRRLSELLGYDPLVRVVGLNTLDSTRGFVRTELSLEIVGGLAEDDEPTDKFGRRVG